MIAASITRNFVQLLTYKKYMVFISSFHQYEWNGDMHCFALVKREPLRDTILHQNAN